MALVAHEIHFMPERGHSILVGIFLFWITLHTLASTDLVSGYLIGTITGKGDSHALASTEGVEEPTSIRSAPQPSDDPVTPSTSTEKSEKQEPEIEKSVPQKPAIKKPKSQSTASTAKSAPSTDLNASPGSLSAIELEAQKLNDVLADLIARNGNGEASPPASDPILQSLGAIGSEAQRLKDQLIPPFVDPEPFNPMRIVIKDASIDVPVLNPSDTSIPVLDNALLSGAVRYPLSARLNEGGNIFIFAHSSYSPNIKNKMFKAFNGVENLNAGDQIILRGKNSGGTEEEYVYLVRSVRKTKAEDELIPLTRFGDRRLTLSTCDSFGSRSSRFVVEAGFSRSYVVGQ